MVTKSIENFTADFHKAVAGKEDGNFVSSALSAHLVLSMAAYGAEGSTAREMRQALYLPGLEADDAEAHRGFQSFIDTLNTVQKVILKIANKIYADKGLSVKDKFKEFTKTYFRSESEVLDFLDSDKSAQLINQWCDDKTNSKIKKILSPADLRSAPMVLLNAVYFKGNWKDKFDEKLTKPKPFHVDKTTTIQVPTMYIKKKFFYKELQELNAECIALPYENEDLFMVIVIPKEVDGLDHVEKNLEKIEIDSESFKFSRREMCLSLPKFKVETTLNLNLHLNNMGMAEMFSGKANFKGISDEPLKVGKVIQKAFIEVNEEGSEAAAVTAVVMLRCAMPRPPFTVNVNRPFLYKIVCKNTTLFSGHIINPLVK